MGNLAEVALPLVVFEHFRRGRDAVVEVHHAEAIRVRGRRSDPFGAREVVCEWLLTEHVVASLEGGDDGILVERVWCGDGDRVEGFLVVHRRNVLVGRRAEGLGELLACFGDDVRTRDDFVAEIRRIRRVSLPHKSEANDTKPDSLRLCSHTRNEYITPQSSRCRGEHSRRYLRVYSVTTIPRES